MKVKQVLLSFIDELKNSEIELYNEAGLQHELGFYLKHNLGNDYSIQLERNIKHIIGNNQSYIKKEMDIYIYDKVNNRKYCIEMKVPNSFQIPKRMYLTFKDVLFLEQLKRSSFKYCFLFFTSPNKSFWQSNYSTENIYSYFNGPTIEFKTLFKKDVPEFIKNENKTDPIIELFGNYKTQWSDLKFQNEQLWRYFLLEI